MRSFALAFVALCALCACVLSSPVFVPPPSSEAHPFALDIDSSVLVADNTDFYVNIASQGSLTISFQASVALLVDGCIERAVLQVDNIEIKSFEKKCASSQQTIAYKSKLDGKVSAGVSRVSLVVISAAHDSFVIRDVSFQLSLQRTQPVEPIHILAGGSDECKSIKSKDGSKCAFVKEYCEPFGSIDYLTMHYCDLEGAEAGSFIILILWLCVLFYLLGSTTEGFFCPSLTVISQKLGLSPAVAGITLLALGNDAPDVFSVIAAVGNDALDLAFGEVAGSGLFVTCFVLGVIVFVSDVQLSRRTFLRDSIIYMFGVVLVILFFLGEGFYLYEAIILLLYYVAYVIIVFVEQYRYQKALQETPVVPGSQLPTSPASSPPTSPTSTEQRPRLTRKSSKSALRERTMSGRIKRRNSDSSINRTYLGKIGVYQQVNSNRDAFWRKDENVIIVTKLPVHNTSLKSLTSMTQMNDPVHPRIEEEGPSAEFGQINSSESVNKNLSLVTSITSSWHEIVEMLEFDKKSISEKLTYIAEAPFIFIRALTIPRVEEGEWNRIYATINITLSPLFFFWAFDIHNIEFGSGFVFWHLVLMIFLPMSVYYAYNTRGLPLSTAPEGRLFYWFVGVAFFMSMAWIYVIANELVALLQSFGLILSLSEYILGVTVLAWGNSMPDLVADVVMAKQGYPQMALGHCYGGPLFNMFFGLSVALVMKCVETLPDPIDISGIANEAFFVLLAVIVGVILAISFAFYFEFSPPKTYSYLMIGYYVSITLCNIMMEAGVFSFPSLKFST